MRTRRPIPASSILLITLAIPLATRAARAADLRGTVRDETGQVVAAARVVVSGVFGPAASTETDRRGAYHVTDLPAGSFLVRALRDGFHAEPIAVKLGASDSRQIDVLLRVSAISEEIVVTASRAEEPLTQVTDSATVITRQQVEAQHVETVAQLLEAVPGFTIQQAGGRGAITSLFARGGPSNYALVLVDGVRVNSFGGGFDFAHILADTVERIEIVRGPQSAVYGSDAIGAVVNIITRHGTGRPRASGLVEGGRYGTSHLAVETNGRTGAVAWGASVARITSDGVVANDAYSNRDVAVNLGYQEGTTRLRGKLELNHNRRGFPGPFGSDPAGTFSGIDLVSSGTNDSQVFDFGAERAIGGRYRQSASFSIFNADARFNSPFGVSETRNRRYAGRALGELAVSGRDVLSLGVEIQRERIRNTYITDTDFNEVPIERTIAGYFVENRWQRAARIFINAGFRLEQIHTDAVAANLDPFVGRPAFPGETLYSANPKLSAAYYLRPLGTAGTLGASRLHGSVGTGIRAPDGFELAFTDNPRLKPERTRSMEVGLGQTFGRDRVAADVVYFRNRYDDLIVAVGRSNLDLSRFLTDNIANARAQGLELQMTTRPLPALGMVAGYTYLHTEILALDRSGDRAPAPFHVGERLIRRPTHSGSIAATLDLDRVAINLRVVGRSGVLDIEPAYGALGGLFPNGGFVVVDGGVEVRLARTVSAIVRADNLLNRRYEEVLGFPALRFTWMAGIKVKTMK